MSKELWESQLELWQSQDKQNELTAKQLSELSARVLELAQLLNELTGPKPCTGKRCACGKTAH
jgi:hypothetical protein